MKKIYLHIALLVSVITVSLGLSSCTVYDEPDVWYLNGTWQCMQYPDETLCFYPDGTGHWQNNYNGDYEDFGYYCEGNYLSFQWFPPYAPSYYEDCTIYMTNSNALQITYPPRDGYGPVTLYYSRIY